MNIVVLHALSSSLTALAVYAKNMSPDERT